MRGMVQVLAIFVLLHHTPHPRGFAATSPSRGEVICEVTRDPPQQSSAGWS
jgi:hypothetical protein